MRCDKCGKDEDEIWNRALAAYSFLLRQTKSAGTLEAFVHPKPLFFENLAVTLEGSLRREVKP